LIDYTSLTVTIGGLWVYQKLGGIEELVN